jgi:autotransporter translocation and assembly factor TamB
MTLSDHETHRTPSPWRPVAVVLLVLLGLAGTPLALLQTPWGMKTVANLALSAIPLWPDTRLEATAARAGFFSGIEIYGIRLIAKNGPVTGGIDTLRVSYRLHELLGSPRRLREIRIAGLELRASRLPRAVTKGRKQSAQGRRPAQVTFDRFELHRGNLEIHVPSFGRDSVLFAKGLDVRVSDFHMHEAMSLALDTLGTILVSPSAPPETLRLAMRGTLTPTQMKLDTLSLFGRRTRVTGAGILPVKSDSLSFAGADFGLHARPLAGVDIERFLPFLGDPGDLTLGMVARGEGSRLHATVDARARRGGRVVIDLSLPAAGGPLSLHTHGRLDDLDLGAIQGGPADSLVVDASWSAELDGPDRARLSGPFEIGLDGTRIGDLVLDLARIDGAFAEGRATANLRARGQNFSLSGDGGATPFDSVLAYHASALISLARVPFPPGSPFSARSRTQTNAPTLFAGDVAVRLHGRGTSPQRATATVSLELSPTSTAALLEAGRIDANLDSGVVRWRLDLGVASGSVRANGDYAFTGPTYRVRRAQVAGVELAAFTGDDTTSSRLDMVFHGEGRGADPTLLRATAAIESLALVHGNHRIDGATATLRVERVRAELQSRATVDGASVDLRGSLEPLHQPRDARFAFDVRDLDLAQVTGDTLLASRIAGHARAELRAPDLAAWFANPPPTEAIEAGRGFVRLELEPSSIRDQNLAVCELRGDLDRGAVQLGGRLVSSFGSARLAGAARPFDANPTLRIEPLEFSSFSPAALLGRSMPIELEGALRARLSGPLDRLAGDLDVTLDGSSVQTVTFDQLAIRSQWTAGNVVGTITARAAGDSADVAFDGAPFADPRRLRTTGRVRAAELARLLGIDSVSVGAALSFGFDGAQPRTGGLDDVALAGSIDGNAWYGDARLDTVAAEVHLANGVADVQRLALRGNLLNADGGGRIVLPRSAARESTDFRLTATAQRLDVIPPIPGIHELAGGGRIDLTVNGPPGAVGVRSEVALVRPHVNDVWADSADVQITGQMNDFKFRSLDATVRARGLVAWPLRERDLDATTTWDGRVLVTDVRTVSDQQRSDHFNVRLERQVGGVRGRLDAFEMKRENMDLQLQKPAPFEFGRQIRIDDLVVTEGSTTRMRIHGGIDSASAVDLRVLVDSLDIGDFLDIGGLAGLGGRLTLEGSITGSRQRPAIQAHLRSQLIAGKRKPALLTGQMAWADSTLDLTAEFAQSPGHRLALESHLPLRLTLEPEPRRSWVTTIEGPTSSRFTAERFDFSWFEPLISPRVARNPRGWLNGDVQVGGTPATPEVSGSLALTDAQVELPRLGVRYEKGEAQVSFAHRTITLDRARISSAGRAEADGTIEFHGDGRRTIDLDVAFHRFVPINTLQTKATLSGGLKLTGTPTALLLRGKVEVFGSTAYVEGGGDSQVEQVELSERDRLDLRERFGVGSRQASGTRPALLDSVDADVTLAIGDNVWVRRRSDPIVALELEGDVHARKPKGGKLDARGSLGIRTGRSYMSFTGRRFDLTHADVRLPGPIDSARVRIEAFYSSQTSGSSSADVDITAVVTMDAGGVVTDLRSEPYMDRSALINYLATGQVQGGMQSGTAYGLAVGSALGAVGGAAGRSLGLDVVQVTMDANGGQTLSAGTYIDPRIYLGFRQPVIQDQNRATNSTSGTTPTEFEVELEARRNLLFNIQGSSARYRFLLRPRLGR